MTKNHALTCIETTLLLLINISSLKDKSVSLVVTNKYAFKRMTTQ